MLSSKSLNKTIPTPLYYQLKTLILDEINNGNYPPGSSIPTEAELSEMFDISRTTVRQAITDLVKEGRLYRKKSKGTFVARPKVEWEMENRTPTFSEQVIASGRKPRIKVLSMEVTPIPKEMENADFSFDSDKVITLKRVRYGDDDPIVNQHTYISLEKAGFVLDVDFEKVRLMQALEKTEESKIVRVCRIAEATLANKEDIDLLNVNKGCAILKVTSYSLNSKDELVECTISRFRFDEGKMHVEFSL